MPLLAGCATLVIAAMVAQRLLRPLPALVGLVGLAVVEPLVYYSDAVKRYSTDAAVVAGALLLTLAAQDRYRTRPLWIALWSILSAAFVLTSQPGVFAVGASTAVLFLDATLARRARSAFWVVVASAPWAAAFGAEYVVDLRSLHANSALNGFWAAGFPPPGAGPGGVAHWLGHDAVALVANPLGLSFGILVLALFGVGLVRMASAPPGAAPAAGTPRAGRLHARTHVLGWRVADAGAVLGVSAALAASVASPVQAAATAVRHPPPVPGGWSTIGDTIRNNEAMLAGLGRIEEVRRAPGPGSAALLIDPSQPSPIRRKSTAPGCIGASLMPPSGLKE